jgi:hypothetical protein
VDDSRVKEIYSGCHDLEKTFREKTFDELKLMLDEHFHCKDPGSTETLTESISPETKSQVSSDPALDEEVPMEFDNDKKDTTKDDTLEDDKVKELLAGLDDV